MSVSLSFLEARVKELTAQNEKMGNDLATANEYALELLLAFDKSQPHYKPISESEASDLVRNLFFEALDN